MKKLVLIVGCLLPLLLMAQDAYYVTMMGGLVYKQQDFRKIQIGDKLLQNQKVVFTKKDDFLIVLNPRGRYKVSLKNTAGTRPSELISILIKDNIRVHADNIRLSSKSMGEEISLAGYFRPTITNGRPINLKTLISGQLKIPIGRMGYPRVDNTTDYFFLQLINASNTVTYNKLKVQKDDLLLSKEDFIFNGKLYSSADGTLKLRFFKNSSTDQQVKEIAEINPVFVEDTLLIQMIQAIKLSLPETSRTEVMKEIYTELYYLFGKPDNQLIETLYDMQQ